MKYYIKEWLDNTASLYTETGEPLWTFSSIEEAMANWEDKARFADYLPHLPTQSVMLAIAV